MQIHQILWSCLASLLMAMTRFYLILPNKNVRWPPRRDHSGSCSLAVFLGSGGHTSEALSLISAIDFSRYTPRTYIISESDHLSSQKATTLELSKIPRGVPVHTTQYSILTIPRARKVHQPLLTTPMTMIRSLFTCLYHVTLVPLLSPSGRRSVFADVLLLNGPGTCFVLCIAVYVNKFLGLPAPRIIYIESFARVQSLSLSGKLLRPLVDRFIVQWPQLLQDESPGECHGWLV